MALRLLIFAVSNCLWELNIRRVGKAKCVFFFFFSLGKEVTSPLISTSDSIENCSGIQLVRFNSIKGARRRQGRMCQVNLRLTLKDRVSRTSTPRPYFLREREKKKKPSNFLLLNTPTQMNSCTVVREGEREKDVKE